MSQPVGCLCTYAKGRFSQAPAQLARRNPSCRVHDYLADPSARKQLRDAQPSVIAARDAREKVRLDEDL